MTKVQRFIVLFCSGAALVGFGLWFVASPDFEPAIGIIAGIGGIVASYWPFAPKKQRLTAEQKIAARDKWRPIFEQFFQEKAKLGIGTDTIIHDVARMDSYPEIIDGKGISSWFRVGLMGTYHRGILLGLRWTHIAQQHDGKWKEQSIVTDGNKVILLGQVPYEAIESVNWDGDDYYNKPHIFCHFDNDGEPYERLFYGSEYRLDQPTVVSPNYYKEVAAYEPKKKWWKMF